MKSTLVFLVALTVTIASPAQAETFNNEAVVALTQAGLSEDVLLAKIEGLPCSFDVSTDAIIALKAADVSNNVIAAMVDRCVGSVKAQGVAETSTAPMVKRPPGIYIDLGNASQHNLKQIRPTVASGGKVTGNGSLLFPFKAKIGIAGPTARTSINNKQSSFYFYFETADSRVSDFGVSGSIAAQSPSEFTLVKLKSKNGQRELVVGKANMFNSNLGIDPKEMVPFSINEINDSVFEVRSAQPLESGEYAFVLRFGDDSYRIFDFSV